MLILKILKCKEDREHAIQITCSEPFVERLGWGMCFGERGADLSVGEG